MEKVILTVIAVLFVACLVTLALMGQFAAIGTILVCAGIAAVALFVIPRLLDL